MDGLVELHEYSISGNKRLCSSRHHEDSCRSIVFNSDGSQLFTASADSSIGAPLSILASSSRPADADAFSSQLCLMSLL